MKFIMLSCRQAAILGVKSSLNGHSFTEKVQLKMHMKICKTCEDYRTDNEILDEAIQILMDKKKNTTIELTPEQKQKILDTLS